MLTPLIHIRIAVGPIVLLELAMLYRGSDEAEEEEGEEPREHLQIGFCVTDIAQSNPDPVFRSGFEDEGVQEDVTLPGR